MAGCLMSSTEVHQDTTRFARSQNMPDIQSAGCRSHSPEILCPHLQTAAAQATFVVCMQTDGTSNTGDAPLIKRSRQPTEQPSDCTEDAACTIQGEQVLASALVCAKSVWLSDVAHPISPGSEPPDCLSGGMIADFSTASRPKLAVQHVHMLAQIASQHVYQQIKMCCSHRAPLSVQARLSHSHSFNA